jgi:hypothetical protein
MTPNRPPGLGARGVTAALALLAMAVLLTVAVELLERIWLPLLLIAVVAVATAALVSRRRSGGW